MAKNEYGFIQKKYRQPIYYRQIFNNWNALYQTEHGKTIMIEAVSHFLYGMKPGAKVDHYLILIQEPTRRRQLSREFTSQKKAMEALEEFITLY